MAGFDTIVLTAANEAQAEGYRAELAWRKENGILPDGVSALVVPDAGNRRIGSFGATLNVLAQLAREAGSIEKAFVGRHILICHSGGDSRRTPAYAAQGKVFTPMPVPGPDPVALFDLILKSLAKLPAPECGSVLVAAGDVLLTFDADSLDLSRNGVTGVAYFDSPLQGSRHGVYIVGDMDAAPSATTLQPVAGFLQKPTPGEARAAGAMTPDGREAVDTGLLSFTHDAVAALFKAAGVADGGDIGQGLLREIDDGKSPALDIYEEFALAIVPSIDEDEYVSRMKCPDEAHERRLRALYGALHKTTFSVNILPKCDFFHIGSSRELLDGFAKPSETAKTYGFANGCRSNIPPASGAYSFGSFSSVPIAAHESFIEGICAENCGAIKLEGRNILTGLPSEVVADGFSLPRGTGLVFMPIGEADWAAVAYGLDDDFKSGVGNGCTFLNEPIEAWMAKSRAEGARLWDGDASNGLWTARLWKVTTASEALADALGVIAGNFQNDGARRYSISQLVPMVNHARLLAQRKEAMK